MEEQGEAMSATEPSISSFIEAERWHYEPMDDNYFALSFGQIAKYHRYILTIKSRFDEESKAYVEVSRQLQANSPQEGITQVDSNIGALLDLSNTCGNLLHLDTESFYVFAKIVLDKIARCIEHYFGAGRGCSLNSHDLLVKNFNKFSGQKGLVVPPDLLGKATKLKEQIADFRDKQIEHNRNHRSGMGTAYGLTEEVVLVSIPIFPKPGDPGQMSSTPLNRLLAEIDDYLVELCSLVRENRLKSVFKIAQPATVSPSPAP